MDIYKLHTKPKTLDGYADKLYTVPELAYNHAKKINGEFPEGEDAIAKSRVYSFNYAVYLAKKRFPKGEAAISTNGYYSLKYADNIIKGRFPEGEEAIKNDGYWANYELALKKLDEK